jgi:hypothetical protein
MLERFLLVDSPARFLSRFMIFQGVIGRKISALLLAADFAVSLRERERPDDSLLLVTTRPK